VPCCAAPARSSRPSPSVSRAASPAWRGARSIGSGRTAPDDLDPARPRAFPAAAERAASPGRALRDVQARLNQYVERAPGGARGRLRGGLVAAGAAAGADGATSGVATPALPGEAPFHEDDASFGALPGESREDGRRRPQAGSSAWPAGKGEPGLRADPGRGPAAPGVFAGAAAGLSDIDARLHALQDFLRAAKAGACAPA
jgi:hypothetical protein